MEYLSQIALTTVIGIISYFLREDMKRSNDMEQKVILIEKDYETKEEHKQSIEKLEKDIVKIREDYTPKEEFKEVVSEFRNDLKTAQKDFLTKEDFIREQKKTEDKLDDIYKLLISELGGRNNG